MKKILVVKNSFVLMGDVVEETAQAIKLQDAFVVRRWGMAKGLGELALRGIQKETVLDPCGDVEIERHAVLFSIICKA